MFVGSLDIHDLRLVVNRIIFYEINESYRSSHAST